MRRGFELSQDELGEILGVTGATIMRWEKNTSKPPGRLLVDMLDICRAVSRDSKLAAEVHGLVKKGTEPAAVLWFILDQIYRVRMRRDK